MKKKRLSGNIRASVFIATSLDGFIAREDGDINWLTAAQTQVPPGEDLGYKVFSDSIDVMVMGRNTYEKVMSFPEWPYLGKKVVVLSHKKINIPKSLLEQGVSCSSQSPENLCVRLAENGAKRLYIDGGITIQRFLRANLITDLTITVIPIILGKGLPLFGSLDKDIALQLIETKKYNFGFVQHTYEVQI